MPFDDNRGIQIALEEAELGLKEGGIPIGACLVHENGSVLGRGHNQRIQKGSPTLHGEIAALENAGRLKAEQYRNSTMYTTLSPCDMCTGACLMYGIKRVVLGENVNFQGAEDLLKSRDVTVINLQNHKCEQIMAQYIKDHPEEWYEDIGV